MIEVSGEGLAGGCRVLVLGGGASPEHEVSLSSAESVARHLDRDRYRVDRVTIGRDGLWREENDSAPVDPWQRLAAADVVMPALHGENGEDGTLAGMLELSGRPYVGCGVRAGAVGMDKELSKLLAGRYGLRVARGIRCDGEPSGHELEELLGRLRAPFVVKPCAGGSSLGVTLVDDRSLLPEVIVKTAATGPVLVEEYIHGREIDIALLEMPDGELITGAPLEIPPSPSGFFDVDRKYGGDPGFVVPAHLGPGLRSDLEDAARRLFRGFGCAGLARVDFFVAGDQVIFNEINTMPGMTRHSQFPRMFEAIGIPYPRLLDHLIETAIGNR